MAQALRNSLSDLDTSQAEHAGLLLNCYLAEPAERRSERHQKARKDLLEDSIRACVRSVDLYRQAFQRWQQSVSGLREQVRIDGRMVLGLGSESPLEIGLRLHHTYGTPILPGSALKGLAAHYCDQVWGAREQEFKREVKEIAEGKETKRPGRYFEVLFGTTEDEGHIFFHDAWITPDSLKDSLALDVMTVHHPKYYQEEKDKGKRIPPSDFDSPTPLTFLSIQGRFEMAIGCDVKGEEGEKWSRLALDLLCEALAEWGIGGKTRAGYGRMRKVGDDADADGSSATSTARPEDFQTGQIVRCVVLEEKTKKGKWRFRIEGTSLTGVLHPHSDEPPDLEPGKVLEMRIESTGKTFQFSWGKERSS